MKGYSPIMAVQSMTGVSTRLAYSRERSNQKKKEQEKENKRYKSFARKIQEEKNMMYAEWQMERMMEDLYRNDQKRSTGTRYEEPALDLDRDEYEVNTHVMHFE